MSLKDCIQRDINTVFLNTDEFADNLILQVKDRRIPIVGSLQQNQVQNNSGTGCVLQNVAWVLYIRYPIDLLEQDNSAGIVLSTNSHITLNDKSYTIVSVSNEMGIATINLSSGAGR